MTTMTTTGDEALRPGRRDALSVQEAEYGGREAVTDILAHTPLSAGLTKLQTLLEDPTVAHLTLRRLLSMARVPMSEYLEAMRKGSVARGQARAAAVLAERLPAVAADMADQAVTRTVACDCTKTLGGGVAMPLASCKECAGRGVITLRPDVARHTLVAEAAGLLKKGPQTVVQQTNQTATAVLGPGFFERLVKATDDITIDAIETTDE